MTNILIVDDSTFMRSVIKEFVESESDNIPSLQNAEFYEADGIVNAIQQIQNQKPDIIFLDIVMKESKTEGVELLKMIKPYFDISKVIVVSSIGQDDVINECNMLGVSTYIQKPFEQEKIAEALKKVT